LYVRRLHPRAAPETAALLQRALNDERLMAELRRLSTRQDDRPSS
jgi:hypothetical protein